MTEEEIKEGDVVEIDYIAEFTKEHINEGKALVIWKDNNQPLVRKLSTKKTIWTCYEHIARVVDHIDIEGYMNKVLSAEPCEDCISRQYLLDNCVVDKVTMPYVPVSKIKNAPPATPQPKTGRWIYDYVSADGHRVYHCSECGCYLKPKHSDPLDSFRWCSHCGAKMVEPQESEEV